MQPLPSTDEITIAKKKYGPGANGREKDRVMVSGSFNDWTPQRMIRLTELLHELDTDKPDIVENMKAQGLIDRSETAITEFSHLTPYLKGQYK